MAYDAEAIERAALADLHAAASPELAAALGLGAHSIGSALVSAAGALPASAIVINRAIGIGLDAPETQSTVHEMVAAYGDAGVGRYFVQRHPDARPAELVDWLTAAGLEKARGWQKFSRAPGEVTERPTDLTIAPVGPELGAAFGRIAADAFDLGQAAVPWLAALPGRAGWHVFMSFDGDEPAGTGAMFVEGDIAWLDFGATAPAFRQRGGQGALLAQRVAQAGALGCRAV